MQIWSGDQAMLLLKILQRLPIALRMKKHCPGSCLPLQCFSLSLPSIRFFSLHSLTHNTRSWPPHLQPHRMFSALLFLAISYLFFKSQLIHHLLWEALPDHSPNHQLSLRFLFHCIPLLCSPWNHYKFRPVCDYLINICFSQNGRDHICFCL